MKVYVDYVRLSNLGEELTACERTVKSKRCGVESIAARLTSDSAMRSVKRSLNELCQDMEYQARSYKALGDTAKTISRCYKTTESNVLLNSKYSSNIISFIKECQEAVIEEIIKKIGEVFDIGPVYEYEMDSIVFDDEGTYGGKQSSPQNVHDLEEKEELYSIVREYYPDMTDQEVRDYLKKVNNEGCGYVALVNTLFAEYEDREDEFSKDFGFPMYGDDGDLNYDKLIVDLYASTDNHYSNDGVDAINEYRDYNEDIDGPKGDYTMYGDRTGSGTTQSEREYQAEMYFRDHGIDCDVKTNQDITVHNYESHVENGEQVIIAYRNGNVYNMDGTVRQVIEGGHAMEVTGVTQEGYYIVSTWGDKCYIDPNEVIEVTDDDGNINETSMTFSTVEYD